MDVPEQVSLVEVGPRDGLQNEKAIVSTEDKVAWIHALVDSGLSYIELTSFVHPKWVPALNDAKDVVQQVKRKKGVTYAALVPNMKGLEGALEANVDEVSVFMSASDTHNRKNINKTIEATYPVLKEVIDEALHAGKSVRGYVSTVFGCPYEGTISPAHALAVTEKLLDFGCREVSLGDTIGVAGPTQVENVLSTFLQTLPRESLALHFHDTRGTALANTLTGLQHGITTFDGACGGLGGCPYAPGAAGNVATEDVVYMCKQMGIQTGVKEEKLVQAAERISQHVSRPLTSRALSIYRSGEPGNKGGGD
ncbi:hydroxymethylglutaryl-CoA lyase [Salsuginibacillus kocurii]|uniref:hydroxymethylglutaryl-CoA lyase n=1 Tax=Salsuginibacillus kocurii TaxID=427078 RepID=UPI00036D3E4E|nr:hydroxymethylglutaryl-CoA lyase [Salsuginibacillus kocurii]